MKYGARFVRGIIQSVIEGTIKRVTVSGRTDETITDREAMEHYGFTSRPLSGAEAVLIQEGNHFVMIASDDRRYRLGIEDGEVCVYTDEGDHIRFKRGKEILIHTGNKVTVDAENEVTVNTAAATINASTSALVKAPAVTIEGNTIAMSALGGGGAAATLNGNFELTGNITVTGNISATGTIIDTAGNTNHHAH